MRTLAAIFFCLAIFALAGGDKPIINCKAWPTVLKFDGKTCPDPTVDLCVQQGYRLERDMPTTPIGKQVKSLTWIQDTNDVARCVAVCVYEDAPIAPPPEVWANIISGKLSVWFTTNGDFRLMEMVDKPTKTNTVPK